MRLKMSLIFKLTSTWFLTFIIACGGSSSSPNVADDSESGPFTIEEILSNTINNEVDGIFVYIEKTNESPIIATAGVQNRQAAQPASADALFKIASISKMYIAVASTMLIHNGTLRTDDTLASWLPDIASRIENSNTITIKNLLQHRSGVPDFDSQTGFSWSSPHTNIDDTLEFALDLPADFSPDQTYEYSNTNYLLIGKILDTALGYSHHIYIQDNILTPLELNDTYSLLVDIDETLLARGYWDNNDFTEQDYAIPGGSMISTVKDTAKFVRGLATGELLDSEARSLYLELFFGYGHSGWLPGYQSIARYHSNLDAVIVQFVNTTGGTSEAVSAASYQELVLLTGG